MKRVKCPQCGSQIMFDESKFVAGQKVLFVCEDCGRKFGIRFGLSKLKDNPTDDEEETRAGNAPYGRITAIEGKFSFRQEIPLVLGDNVIGRKMRGNKANCQIDSGDLTMDLSHCVINVSKDKNGKIKYVLRDGPSNNGTFLAGERIDPQERRNIEPGALLNIGATTIMLEA